MPLGKWLTVGILVGAVGAVGCGDDDNKNDNVVDSGTGNDSGTGAQDSGTDSGGGEKDSGSGGSDSGTDSGSDAGDPCDNPDNVCCGTPKMLCKPFTAGTSTFEPGCAMDTMDAEVCGLATESVLGDAGPASGFLPLGAPGVDSMGCGMLLDNFDTLEDGGLSPADAGTKGNAMLDRYVKGFALGTPGCCTPLGFCSGNTDKAMLTLAPGSDPVPFKGGFGCMDSRYFLGSAPEKYQRVPCDPSTGDLIMVDAGASDAGAGDAGTDAGDGG